MHMLLVLLLAALTVSVFGRDVGSAAERARCCSGFCEDGANCSPEEKAHECKAGFAECEQCLQKIERYDDLRQLAFPPVPTNIYAPTGPWAGAANQTRGPGSTCHLDGSCNPVTIIFNGTGDHGIPPSLDTYNEQCLEDPCSDLVHELYHARTFSGGTGIANSLACQGNAVVQEEDLSALMLANLYRSKEQKCCWRKAYSAPTSQSRKSLPSLEDALQSFANSLTKGACQPSNPLQFVAPPVRAEWSQKACCGEAPLQRFDAASAQQCSSCGDKFFTPALEECDLSAPDSPSGQACPLSQCGEPGSLNECRCGSCTLPCAHKFAGEMCNAGPVAGSTGHCTPTVAGDLVCYTEGRIFCFQFEWCNIDSDCSGGGPCIADRGTALRCTGQPFAGYCPHWIWGCP